METSYTPMSAEEQQSISQDILSVLAQLQRLAAMHLHTITLSVLPDPDPDTSYLDDDGRRHYADGDFTYVGVRATAEYVVDGTMQTVHSPGLWGIECWHISSEIDRSEEYICECLDEQESLLLDSLRSLGFTDADIKQCVCVWLWNEAAR